MSIKDYLPEDVSTFKGSREDTIDMINEATILAFKDKIRRRRHEMKMKQEDLAETVGVKQPAISRIENPENKSLAVNTLRQVAMSLDCVLVVDLVPRSTIIKKLEESD